MYLSSVSSRLVLYDVNSWDVKRCHGDNNALLRDVSWSNDGKYVLQVNSKGVVEILGIAETDLRVLQQIPIRDTWSASFRHDGHRNVAIGTKTGNVVIWDTKNTTITKSMPTPPNQAPVNFLSFNCKDTNVAATMQNGETVIYGLASNIPVQTVKLQCSKSISAMSFHNEIRGYLGLATDEGHVVVRDITMNKDKATFHSHASPVSGFTYSLVNKDVLLSSGLDKVMHVYDIRLSNVVSTIRTNNILTSIAINVENQVALGTKNGLILIYDLRDLLNPLKVLLGHEDPVSKVSFQPVKKKTAVADFSLREADISPEKPRSPYKSRNSDLFFVNDSPRNIDVSGQLEDNKADSFLVMLGLDHSVLDEEGNRIGDFEKSDKLEKLENKNLSKVSTPLTSRIACNLASPSPIVFTNPAEANTNATTHLSKGPLVPNDMNARAIEELKDMMGHHLSDIAEDNKDNFLNMMMLLTKQKLFLEKEVSAMNGKIEVLVQNQNMLMEVNRNLAMEINTLKAQSHTPSKFF